MITVYELNDKIKLTMEMGYGDLGIVCEVYNENTNSFDLQPISSIEIIDNNKSNHEKLLVLS
jgi:hypothetical protein